MLATHSAVCKLLFAQQSSHWRRDVKRLIHKLFLKCEEKLKSTHKNSIRVLIWLRLESIPRLSRRRSIVIRILFSNQSKTSMENSPISAEKLRQMYAAMFKLRLLAKHLRSHSRIRRTPPPSCREACEIGCTIDLQADDTLVTLPAKEMDLSTTALLRFLDHSEIGNSLPKTHGGWPSVLQTHHFGQRVALATGAACLHRGQQKGNLVVAFVEGNEIGSARDSLRFAHDQCLPIIFVQLENSRFNSSGRTLVRSPNAMPVLPVDQVDVVAIYRVSFEAIDKARRGAGPTLIQCVRSQKTSGQRKSEKAESRDPLLYMERYLRRRDLWSDDLQRSAAEDFSRAAKIS
jgi:pyruvate dehydrogenase E1 component alpha subunit